MRYSKEKLIEISNETMVIIEAGKYVVDTKQIALKEFIKTTDTNTILYNPDMFIDLEEEIESVRKLRKSKEIITEITVSNETTMQADERLAKDGHQVVCLNFASAIYPGGGFLKGSVAQEEAITRASALYSSISKQKEMYEYNSKQSYLYSDYMIYLFSSSCIF